MAVVLITAPHVDTNRAAVASGKLIDSLLPAYRHVPQYQDIHLGSQKAIERLFRLADDGLILIERSVQHHWYPSAFIKGRNQLPIERIGVAATRFAVVPIRRRGSPLE